MGWVENATPAVEAASQYPAIIAICVISSLFSVAIVNCRLKIRTATRGFANDDWMATLSMIFALVYSILCIIQTKYGLGLPITQRPMASKVLYTRVNFVGRPIYQVGISFFKIALLISYLRLLRGTDQKTYRRIVQFTIAIIFLAHVGCALSLIFACRPVDKSWNPWREGTCLPNGPSFTGYAIVTIVSDIVVALLPIPVLLKLNIQLEKKLGLIGIFLLGLFTTLCSILRYMQIDRIQYGDGNSTMLVLWGVIEFNVGNMVSSLPFLAPVCLRKAREYRSKHSANEHSSASGTGQSQPIKEECYKLNAITTTDKNLFPAPEKSDARDVSLRNHSIMKSITYSVQSGEHTNADHNAAQRCKVSSSHGRGKAK